MQRVKEAIKEKVGRHRHKEDEYEAHGATADTAYTTGMPGTTGEYGTGTTGMPGTTGEYGTGTTGMPGTTGEYGTGATGMTGTTGQYATGTAGGEYVGERPVAVGTAEVPVVVTEQERVGAGGVAGGVRAGEEVCGVKTFTEVEDRPVVVERVERVLEHHPVEKEYVVETRFAGERPIHSAAGGTVIDVDERVVEAAEPGPKCPTSAGGMMNEAAGRTI